MLPGKKVTVEPGIEEICGRITKISYPQTGTGKGSGRQSRGEKGKTFPVATGGSKYGN